MPRTLPQPVVGQEPASFEDLLGAVVALMADRTSRDPDDIEGALAPVARFFGADQACFARLLPDGAGWDGTHVFTLHGRSSGLGRDAVWGADGPTWTDRQLLEGTAVLANELADLPTEADRERAGYARLGLRSVLDVPLHARGGRVIATMALRTHGDAAPWTDRDARRLQLAGEVLLGLLATAGHEVPDAEERRRLARDFERVEERLFVAMAVASTGVFDWDVGADRVWFLSPFISQRPYPRDTHETDGSQWFRSTHPDDVPLARTAVDRAIAGEADRFDNTVRMKVPHYRGDQWVHVRSRGEVMARDASGRATRIIGIYQDISAEVQRAHAEREREAALEHATRSAALGTLATSLAHELNQPLAALTSFVQASVRLLDRGDASRDEVKDALRRSAALAEKASEIVRRLRRLVQHSPPLHEEVDVAATLGAVQQLLGRDAQAARVELRVAPAPAGLSLRADRVQLEQVLVNLVRNALEATATATGPRRVTVEATDAGDRVEFRVGDTGPGVDPAVARRLFEPFFTTKTAGTGLGLTISRSIVEAHGGAIRLERTGPDGTSFVVALPRTGGADHGEG